MPGWHAGPVPLVNYADVLGLDASRLTLACGQRHDVVLDATSQLAWRFPRTALALEALPRCAGQASRAHQLGLGAPQTVDVVLGHLGVARMGSRLVAGVGLSPAVTSRLSTTARRRLVSDLAGTLARLAAAPTDGWPGEPLSWSQRWLALTERLASDVLPLITDVDQRARAEHELADAAAAAASCAEVGVIHADLGGENLHVDPRSGAVVGILDWDEAGPGDPAVDLAAMLAHAEPWLRDALLAYDRQTRALASRARAYAGTFAMQEALWGLDDGDPEAVDRGLAGYR